MSGPERSFVAPATMSRLRALAVVLALALTACDDRVTQPSARPRPGSPAAFDVHGNWGQRGRLVGATLVQTIDRSTVAGAIRTAVAQNSSGLSAASKAAIQDSAVAAFETHYDIEQWSIKYTTVGVHGELVVVSAGVYLPAAAADPLPLVSVSHGTLTDKHLVPSNTGIIAQGIGHASHGSVAVFADYIGMGSDAGDFPPYLVADVGATTSLDALSATRQLLKDKGLSLDGRLFLSGYSQGGQVAMALARLIESDPRSRFKVTAAAPAAGPYDLYGSARAAFLRTTPYVPLSIYVIYGSAALNATYGLADRLDELLTPSAAAIGEKLLTVGMTQAEVVAAVPRIGSQAMQPDVLNAFLCSSETPAFCDPNAPPSAVQIAASLADVLRANQTYDWLPSAPLRMYFGEADIDVPTTNAPMTAEHMHALGASPTDVTAEILSGPAGEKLTHPTALWPSIIASRKWFDSFPAPAKADDLAAGLTRSELVPEP